MSPDVECSCCTKCQNDLSDTSKIDYLRLCDNFGALYSRLWANTSCDCESDRSRMICNHVEDGCRTCTHDSTACGESTEFGYRLEDGSPTNWINAFLYTSGQYETTQIDWEGHDVNLTCTVGVNGDECRSCTYQYCNNGFLGLMINCTNVVEGGSGFYDSCLPLDNGGVFDVFYSNGNIFV